MKRIDQQTVQRIIDTADIVEVVSDFVDLKRRGANYVGLCPFHNDRSPSFSVNRVRGICKCFSCGEGGNAVNFVMKIRQCSYGEALRYLAAKYNIEIHEAELTDEELRQRQERDALFAATETAGVYFAAMRDTAEGRAALEKLISVRSIPISLLDRYDIGYAPICPSSLIDAMSIKGFSLQAVCAAGLAYSPTDGEGNPTGAPTDIFNGVITVGIRNRYGRITGFEGYNPDGSRASVIMPDTAIHCRQHSLYGLWQARGPVGRTGGCILLQDPLQLLWLARTGIDNTIALPSPVLNEERVQIIKKITYDVTLLLPSGSRAIFGALRSALPLLASGVNIKVVTLPTKGQTLMEFVDSNTSETVVDRLTVQATDMVIFKIEALRRARMASSTSAYRTLFDDLIITIRSVCSPLLREAYLNELSDATGQTLSQLSRLLGFV